MKSKLSTLSMALLLLSLNAWSQSKKADLQVTILQPANNSVLKLNEMFELVVEFKNLGPDPVGAGDTLAFAITGFPDVQGVIFSENSNIPIGGTYIHTDAIFFSQAPLDTPLSFCAYGEVGLQFLDSNKANNEHCITISFTGTTNSVSELLHTEKLPAASLEIFPTPADNIVHLKHKAKESGPVFISIFDITGKKVAQHELAYSEVGSQDISLDVSSLSAGSYFVELVEANIKARGRLLIKR